MISLLLLFLVIFSFVTFLASPPPAWCERVGVGGASSRGATKNGGLMRWGVPEATAARHASVL